MKIETKRVVITGMGVITSIGKDVETYWSSLQNGVCGISAYEKAEENHLNVKVASLVRDFVPSEHGLTPPEARKSDRFSQFATAAALQALKQSGLEIGNNIANEEIGVYVGSGIGGLETFVNQTKVMLDEGADRVSPLFVPMMIPNMGPANIAIKIKAKGPCVTNVSACATSTNSIGEAFRAIQFGDATAIIAGGAEAVVHPLAMGSFMNAKALSVEPDPGKACRPFDAQRSGFVMGEGAGMVVLEEYEHAVARGANIICEVVGYGNTCDAYHITAPDPEAKTAARAIRKALDEAGYQNDEMLYINAHGTGTHLNDAAETKAIKIALGEETARKAVISSTKSMTGHLLGAAGAIELVASALAIRDGIVPPTIGYENPDPECDLDIVPNKARKCNPEVAISNSLGFGGHNACVALRKLR